jgi:uncharacterized membrane protein YhaH (DUF805 family)
MMFEALRKYAQFEGRARRSEYWLFVLLQVLLMFGFMVLFALVGGLASVSGASAESAANNPAMNAAVGLICLLFIVVGLGVFIPSLAVSVRRLHDSDKSGWWLLLSFIPFGGFVVFIFTLLDGTPGPNRYGADPKGREGYGNGPAVVHHHHYAPGVEPAPPAV